MTRVESLSLDQQFERAMPLGAFSSALGSGQIASERVGELLRVYLKVTDGFSFTTNFAFREQRHGKSDAVFDDPRTTVRFVIGPTPWEPGAGSKSVEVKPATSRYAFATIPVAELKVISQGRGLAMYAEISATNWSGGTTHSFLNLDGRSFSNFMIPDGLVESRRRNDAG